ncbi:hypothetical protein LSUB1_G007988 [Lachnellula subtilissima]|uniref:Uncharacterized protein n=1 Tax=Lachnellula subtilissima TaxID=602034 RepID=A0A8H8RCZ6_9HELO|nr:hypothetical protein LSUB1_G007988 [Lachnellula subtilissima]
MATYHTTAIERLGAKPYIITNLSEIRSISHSLFTQLFPNRPSLDITPRIIAYIARSYRPRVALASKSPYDSNFQVLNVIDQDHTIKVYNIYNEKHQLPNSDTRTLARCLWQLIPPLDSDPLYKARDIEGIALADWIDHHDLALLNTPGIGTFHRSYIARPTNINLTLAHRSIANHIQDWAIIEDIGSDHLGIPIHRPPVSIQNAQTRLNLLSPLQDSLHQLSYSLSHNYSLKSLEQIDTKTSYKVALDQLNDMAERYTSAILCAAHDSIPQIRLYKSLFRPNQFLEKEDSKSIFKALAYTKPRRSELVPNLKLSATEFATTFTTKCNLFRQTLFPPPPETPSLNWSSYTTSSGWKWPKLALEEVKLACSSEIKSTTCPSQILLLFKTLVNIGYHLKCWRQANCAILRKNNKPDYKQPSAYRPILLLSCLGKISERILAKRLAYLAETTSLLYPS